MTTEATVFRVEAGGQVDLTKPPTAVKPLYRSHKDYKKQLKKHVPTRSGSSAFPTSTKRSYWNTYMSVYGDCLSATSSTHAPWYVVPTDDKHNARSIISQVLLDTLSELNMAYPETTDERHRQLETFRSQL